MAIVVKAVATAVASVVGTSITVNVPAGTVDGDVMIAQIAHRGTGSTTITPPAGWTLVILSGTGLVNRSGLYVRTASSEPATYTWTLSANLSWVAGIVSCSGVDATTPVNASGGQTSGTSTLVTAPSITTTVNNCLLLFFGSIIISGTFTPDPAMTEWWDITATTTSSNESSELATEAFGVAGSTGTRVATASTSQNFNVGQLVALIPAAATEMPRSHQMMM